LMVRLRFSASHPNPMIVTIMRINNFLSMYPPNFFNGGFCILFHYLFSEISSSVF
jgi:hypothetical protein